MYFPWARSARTETPILPWIACAWMAVASMLLLSCGGDDSGSGSSGPVEPPPSPTPLNLDLEIEPNGQYVWYPMPIPADNPTTVEGAALGRRLFFDPILSSDDEVSCSTCHDPAFAFSGGPVRFSTGVNGRVGEFNSPALINLGWTSADPYRLRYEGEFFALFWDGHAESLEEQAREPVSSPVEMDLPWPEAEAKVRADPVYPGLFRAAFGDGRVTQDRIVKALAQFQRTLRSYESKWDRLQQGRLAEGEEWTAEEILGFTIFMDETGDCFHCHGTDLALFVSVSSSGLFNNNGLDSSPDPGLMAVTGDSRHEGKFRVPTLRNIEYTAPYMHDGRFETLDEVLQHYSHGVATDSPNLDSNLKARVETGPFTAEQIEALKAFLLMLSDPGFLTEPDFQNPFLESSG